MRSSITMPVNDFNFAPFLLIGGGAGRFVSQGLRIERPSSTSERRGARRRRRAPSGPSLHQLSFQRPHSYSTASESRCRSCAVGCELRRAEIPRRVRHPSQIQIRKHPRGDRLSRSQQRRLESWFPASKIHCRPAMINFSFSMALGD